MMIVNMICKLTVGLVSVIIFVYIMSVKQHFTWFSSVLYISVY